MTRSKQVMAMAAALLFACVNLQAQEKVRSGVVTAMTQTRAAPQQKQSAAGSAFKGLLGRVANRAMGRAMGRAIGGIDNPDMADAAATTAQSGSEVLNETMAESAKARAAAAESGALYMVVVRLKNGQELAFSRPGKQLNGISVGTRVKIVGDSEQAIIIRE